MDKLRSRRLLAFAKQTLSEPTALLAHLLKALATVPSELVVRPGAPSSILAPSSTARSVHEASLLPVLDLERAASAIAMWAKRFEKSKRATTPRGTHLECNKLLNTVVHEEYNTS